MADHVSRQPPLHDQLGKHTYARANSFNVKVGHARGGIAGVSLQGDFWHVGLLQQVSIQPRLAAALQH
jgi:hypothetical protein